MMTFSPTSRQVILHEKFDESSEPNIEEIQEYALRIGIKLEDEPELLPLARDCLMQALPAHWKPCLDTDCPDAIYYFNFKTGRAQWAHPLDEVHRELVKKARAEATSSTDQLDDDSRTTVKEDLKSYEETFPTESQSSEIMNKPRLLEPLAPLQRTNMRKPPTTLGPIRSASPLINSSLDSKKMGFDEVKKRPNSSDIRNRRNIEPMEFRHLSKQEIITPRSPWRDEGYVTESSTADLRREAGSGELILAGGGNMFLKKPTRKTDDDLSPKSILRKDIEDEELLIEKPPPKEDPDEERKSVRFKLENEIKVNFEMPATSSTSDEQTSVLSGVKSAEKSDPKQIELDFDDLHIEEFCTKVPNNHQNEYKSMSPKISNNPVTKSSLIDNEAASTNNNVNNLIDLTDIKPDSIVDNNKPTIDDPPKSINLRKLEPGGLGYVAAKKNLFENECVKRYDKLLSKGPPKLKVRLDDVLRMSESEVSSQSGDDVNSISIRDDVISVGEGSVEKTRAGLEVAKAEKLKELEGGFNLWVKNTEKIFKDKEKQHYHHIKEKYEDLRKNQENEMIKEISELYAEESQGKIKALKNELLKEEQEAVTKLREELAAQQKERLHALRLDIQALEDKEMTEMRKSLEENLAERKKELLRKHQEETSRMELSLETKMSEQRVQRQLVVDKARVEEAALLAKRAELNDAFVQQKTVLEQEHALALQKLRQQQEAEMLQAINLPKQSGDPQDQQNKDASEPRDFDKLQSEKKVIEEKYKSLKEKYVRLKTDVKLTLEKRIKKREVAYSASETEKSNSNKVVKSETESPHARRKPVADKKGKIKKQQINLDNVNQNVPLEVRSQSQKNCESRRDVDDSSGDERRRRQIFSKLKAASTSRLNYGHRADDKDDTVSPVENLRRQLKKLEELEDQFPVTTHTDTYLRYPFTDAPAPHVASSELEFFKHRIHLERDSVRRAKEFLKTQKKCYENRQVELQSRLLDGGPSSKTILEQIHQEERELTEMEVSVHRTRALLGEKIIRLRHLEQSLQRVTPNRRPPAPRSISREDGTLSDLSSHSDSSGFSSTHHTSELTGPRPTLELNRRHLHTTMQESSEIIQSLENLNSEIRGIWEVLKQQSSVPGAITMPPPPLAWPAVRTNPSANVHVFRPLPHQIMTQVSASSNVGHVTTVVDPTLLERTRSLRDWLKSARRSPNPGDTATSNQVTL